MEQLKDFSHLDWVQTALNVFVICSFLITVFGLFALGVISYLTRPGFKEIDEEASKEEVINH